MTISMMINNRVQTQAAYRKFDLSLGDSSFRRSPNINYICAPTTEEIKKKIISSLETLSFPPHQSILVQFWAATEFGERVVLLTTTCQPFGLFGNNKELQAYHKACLDHKFYVYRTDEEEKAFGLPGTVFLYCTPAQTQNVHGYHPTDHRPQCDGAVFDKIWGSFGVPIVYANKCVGVLDFLMDTPKDSYEGDIEVVNRALQDAGFQCSTQHQTNLPRRTYTSVQKRSRETDSSSYGKYWCLAQRFGLSSVEAAAKIGETIGKPVTPGTFRNACRNVAEIPEWPNCRTIRDSSYPKTQINPTTSQAPISEYSTNQIACDASSSRLPIAIEYPSFGSPAVSEYTVSNTSSFGASIAREYSSFGAPIANEYNSFGAPVATDYMVSQASSFGCPTARDHMSDFCSLIPIQDIGTSQWSYTQSETTTEVSSFEARVNQIEHDASSFVTPDAMDTSVFGTQVAVDQYCSFGTPITVEGVGNYEWSTIQDMTAGASFLETPINQIAPGGGWIEGMENFENWNDIIPYYNY